MRARALSSTLLVLVAVALAACQAAPARKAPARAPNQQAASFAGPGVRLAGEIFLPAGSATRHPAVVLLHGCGGMVLPNGRLPARNVDWAQRFAAWGYVALLVDSFGPRGHGSVCDLKDAERPTQPWKERTADAYAALDYLSARPDVDARNVFVMGWSHGGSTVMGIERADAPGLRPGGPRFRAAVAFYPGCRTLLRTRNYRPATPLLILHGAADDWVPAAPCVELAQRLQQQGYPVRAIAYPDALHGFDTPNLKLAYLPNVWNPNDAAGGRGAHIGSNEPARQRAIADVRGFFEEQRLR